MSITSKRYGNIVKLRSLFFTSLAANGNNVQHIWKKDYIQYPHFTKLIIADLMKKFTSISSRLEEDYHSIKDDIPLVSVYTIGNVTVRGMLISDAFLTKEISTTNDYKKYETVFVGLDVPMSQPQLVVFNQGTHRTTTKAHRTPTLTTVSPQGKKRKQSAGETSSPNKSLKVTIKQKPKTTSIPPPSDDRKRDEIAEAALFSLALHKTAIAAEAQKNVAKVQGKLAEEEIEKMVKREEDDESYASVFADSMLNDDVDDSDTRIELVSHKETLKDVEDGNDVNVIEKKDDEKNVDNDETADDVEEKDDDDQTDHALVGPQAKGSIESRNEQMQTPIPTPNRSPKKDLSSDKIISKELTATVSPTTATTSKQTSKFKHKGRFTSYKTKIFPGSIAGMCR
ncbi:hypothetical protein Tco_0189733 [Tanacetum coccineum]